MTTASSLPLFNADDLRCLATRSIGGDACPACAELVCPGWETLSGAFDRRRLVQVGTLQVAADDGHEPTLSEHHPRGSHGWSADAPIAPAWFPYNRCEVWQCRACARAFLRYTEYGGYYHDERIRALDAALLDDTPAPD